ncbi:hypothetical protein RHGRI_000645 [Rhododendron griersonianum]|uniref:Binding protein n=1 Tax=Rhododendron griersonianum TaxID=479676 RepID=A0AAV6LJW2_9ERIC|nr:hypothetical protein RHGRI_000645 [Rhododendron griersonianum]
MMLRSFLLKGALKQTSHHHPRFNPWKREMHSRNKKAMELIAKGWSALKEVDRVIDYAELKDKRLIPLLRAAKENFELALEADNTNTHARYWLSRLHMKYHVPGASKAIGAALLVEAADMGDPEAQYELGCRLRVENDYVQSDQQAFYYLENAVDQVCFPNTHVNCECFPDISLSVIGDFFVPVASRCSFPFRCCIFDG